MIMQILFPGQLFSLTLRHWFSNPYIKSDAGITMNIGVDTYYLSTRNIDGLGYYLLRLLRQLSRIDTANNYFLYTPGITHRDYADSMLENPRFTMRVIPGIFRDKRRFWLQSPSLKRQIKRDRIDMFFAGAEYFPLGLPRSVYIATTVHDVAFKAVPEAISLTNSIFYNCFFPFFLKRSDSFFTVSHHSKKEMVNYLHIDDSRITVVHNGIDLTKFSPAKKKDKKNYILFVGTLQPRKNLVNIVRAYAMISDRIDDTLVIVGAGGWKNSPLRDLMESLPEQVTRKIIFKGYVSGDELSLLYREAKLFTLPSLHEGFCLPILEAMASGTAVLTAPRTAIPEVFGDAAEYADPYSPEDIALKLHDLVTDEKKRERLQKLGLVLSKKYDVANQASGYLDTFKKIEKKLINQGNRK